MIGIYTWLVYVWQLGQLLIAKLVLHPIFLCLGKKCFQPIDLMLHPGGNEDRGTPVTYVTRHQDAMRMAHREAWQKLQQSQRRQKRDYDLHLEKEKKL